MTAAKSTSGSNEKSLYYYYRLPHHTPFTSTSRYAKAFRTSLRVPWRQIDKFSQRIWRQDPLAFRAARV